MNCNHIWFAKVVACLRIEIIDVLSPKLSKFFDRRCVELNDIHTLIRIREHEIWFGRRRIRSEPNRDYARDA